jgi:lysophospholipase L1-like esterase
MKSFRSWSLILQSTVFLTASVCFACPPRNGVPDFNSDGEVRVVVMGDSIPFGFGDTLNGNKGGYVLRAARQLPAVTFVNFARRGLFTRDLVGQLNKALNLGRNEAMRTELLQADVVIFDLGRNDRWFFGLPSAAYRNLKRARTMIQRGVTERGALAPLVVTAVMMLPNRGAQAPWVTALNTLIAKSNTLAAPCDLHFDEVSKRLLGPDMIHPTSAGYAALSAVLVSYLKKVLPAKVAKLHPDTDGDTLPDVIETQYLGTSPNLTDSDGDGISDGEEVCSLKSDPNGPLISLKV